ncbi:MAG: hypothetical protein JWO88_4003, partial [Frankiales bacterium]|nr:hypothetical protein [Frankiales bacterium]
MVGRRFATVCAVAVIGGGAAHLGPGPTGSWRPGTSAATHEGADAPRAERLRVATTDELGDAAELALQDAASMLPRSYAGAWIDRVHGRIHLGVSHASDVARVRRLSPLADLASSGRLTVDVRRFSLSELEATMRDFSQKIVELAGQADARQSGGDGPATFASSVDIANDEVEVLLSPRLSRVHDAVVRGRSAETNAEAVHLRFDRRDAVI